MPQSSALPQKKRAAAAACVLLLLLLLSQQVCAGPLAPPVRSGSDRKPDSNPRPLRRTARMTPLWRTMNSKPFGAYCQNSYECSTGLCRTGHCHRSISEPVNY